MKIYILTFVILWTELKTIGIHWISYEFQCYLYTINTINTFFELKPLRTATALCGELCGTGAFGSGAITFRLKGDGPGA